jgi:Cof subfamily protein (haloacid dehalogenase superfamily)
MKCEPQTYKVAFIDLDDTLLGPAKQIDPANLQALDLLREAGLQIAIASGRHHHNITGFEKIGPQEWVLSSHGSVVRHVPTGEILAEVTLDSDLVRELCARGRALGFNVITYHRDGAYIERRDEWTDLYAQKAGWNPRVTDFRALDPSGFQKVLWTAHPDRVRETTPQTKDEFGDRLNVMITNSELLEFFSLTANKAIGAQALTHRLGIRSEEAVAFGDGHNDVEILGWAGMSVAMNHGSVSAREAARFVSPPGPRESAFARAVELTLAGTR